MTTLKRLTFLIAVLALAIAGCSDDDNPADNGNTDTTAPSVSSVTPIDGNHIDVAFSENVQRTTAEEEANYVIIDESPPSPLGTASLGDTLLVAFASLNADNRTVSLTTDPMGAAVPYEMFVTGVADANGNVISVSQDRLFTGTDDADVTAPEIAYRNPGPNATGVGIAQPVTLQYTELAFIETVAWTSAGGSVPFNIFDSGPEYVLQPLAPLAMGTVYTITISVHDEALNSTGDIAWSFTTTNTNDTTPPNVTSSSPANLATNVSVTTNVSLTFSEAINQVVLDVQVSPEPSDGDLTWSNSGKTITFDPDSPLDDDTQYTITLLPNSVMDLAGNGNTGVINIIFTTGSSLESGSFTGTLAGDPTSDFADDPTGATVIAGYPFPFSSDEFLVFGSDNAGSNNTYDILHLPDGVYYPVAVLNTNGDDEIDPESGDAVGAYGADLSIGDFDPDSVTVAGGNRITGVNFPLFDPSAISGSITYTGVYADEFHELQIGVFDTTAFDPNLPPDYGTDGFWPFETEWRIGELSEGLADGVYYVGAYMDANNNAQFDPDTDPAGLYGGITPIPIRIQNGSDAVRVVVTLEDVLTTRASASVTWPRSANRAPWLKQLSAVLRQQAIARKK